MAGEVQKFVSHVAHRDGQGDRGAGRGGEPNAGGLALRRARASGRRPGNCQDARRKSPGAHLPAGFPARPVHARFDARGHSGRERVQHGHEHVHSAPRPGVHRTCCWWTRSTACRRERSPRCWKSMEERQVTLDGTCYPLSPFFTVFATQNPVEFEGTYPLPEAQLDRFLFKIRVPYPAADKEVEILERYQQGFDPHHIEALGLSPVEPGLLAAARREVADLTVEPGIFRYIVAVVQRTRDWPALSLGGSPRATVALMLAAKTLAAMEGRDYLIPDDVKAAAPARASPPACW